MIIPVRCVTCNKVLADKYEKWKKLIKTDDSEINTNIISTNVSDYKTESKELKAFKVLNITRYCCKRHILSHIDLIEKI